MKKTTMPSPGISHYLHSVPSIFGQAKKLKVYEMSESAQVKRIISVGHMTQQTDFSTILLHVEKKRLCSQGQSSLHICKLSHTENIDKDFHNLQ